MDVAADGALRQRWFGVVDPEAGGEAALHAEDPWWKAFAGGRSGSLLRVEQWFTADPEPFRDGLPGGHVSFDARRSLLKQWLDLSGPSLVALRIHAALHR